jgi:predicted nuclease of restriction endonuclease-like (RecB) superfamily
MQELAKRLIHDFGKGFGLANLRNMRQFYQTYPDGIRYEPSSESLLIEFKGNLSWTHYRILMRESRKDVRRFYEIEASKNHWSTTELERQMGSLLYERLLKSRDKEGVKELSTKGQIIRKPIDALKDPLILEFLDIPESHRLLESDLEQALITNLQHFLLELGKGFAFIARQQRITLNGDHFYPDLIFYHVVLKCYIVIEIKTHKLTHQDIGQIQMYVNYYDKDIVIEGDNPTIGLLLCAEKNDAVVRYTLGEGNNQIFASKYQFHLPTTEELEKELKREVLEISKELKDNYRHDDESK